MFWSLQSFDKGIEGVKVKCTGDTLKQFLNPPSSAFSHFCSTCYSWNRFPAIISTKGSKVSLPPLSNVALPLAIIFLDKCFVKTLLCLPHYAPNMSQTHPKHAPIQSVPFDRSREMLFNGVILKWIKWIKWIKSRLILTTPKFHYLQACPNLDASIRQISRNAAE